MARRLKKLNGLQPVNIDVDKNPVSDLEPLQEMIEDIEKEIGKKPFIFSSISDEGIEDLTNALFDNLKTIKNTATRTA